MWRSNGGFHSKHFLGFHHKSLTSALVCIKAEWLRLSSTSSTDFSDKYRNKHTNCIAWSTMDAMDKPLDAASEAREWEVLEMRLSVKNGDFYHLKLGFHQKWRLYYETWWWNNKKMRISPLIRMILTVACMLTCFLTCAVCEYLCRALHLVQGGRP